MGEPRERAGQAAKPAARRRGAGSLAARKQLLATRIEESDSTSSTSRLTTGSRQRHRQHRQLQE
jgi:hypothetical protein